MEKRRCAEMRTERSVLQMLFQSVFCPLQCATDRASVYTPLPGDLHDVHFLKIIGKQHLSLQRSQFLPDHMLYPLQKRLSGKPWTFIAVRQCIFHCESTPCRSSGLSALPARSFLSVWV